MHMPGPSLKTVGNEEVEYGKLENLMVISK